MAEVKNICLEALERRCESGDIGRLDLRRGGHEGQIFTAGKHIVHAQIAGLDGIPALFRLFDWGDAETMWQSGEKTDKPTLNLTMDSASQLYAENLQERSELGVSDREKLDEILAPEAIAAGQVGVESVLKHYTISLECSEPSLLPGGFTFSDATKSSYVIGSSPDADVVLKYPGVDALHCGVILERGTVLVWDLGAASGVKLNGNPIAQDFLKVGDVMTLGTLDLNVRYQIRRPTIKPKTAPMPAGAGTPAAGTTAAPGAATPAATTTPAAPAHPEPPSKEIPKGAITYDKVQKQLRKTASGASFLDKLGSMFTKKK